MYLGHHRDEDSLVCLVVDPITQRHVHSVVLALLHSDILCVASTWKEVVAVPAMGEAESNCGVGHSNGRWLGMASCDSINDDPSAYDQTILSEWIYHHCALASLKGVHE